jgi:hypothetical protein
VGKPKESSVNQSISALQSAVHNILAIAITCGPSSLCAVCLEEVGRNTCFGFMALSRPSSPPRQPLKNFGHQIHYYVPLY